jgi:uncharacterized Fe-S cluster-containing radical SAM superfamily protein
MARSRSGHAKQDIVVASEQYPRFVTPNFQGFDAIELARKTEEIVCNGDQRKYTAFYSTGVYGGICTGYACGCCLRCVFCWIGLDREFPESVGKFYSPGEVMKELEAVAGESGVRKVRISGCEPTLFVLETNGMLFGLDESYVRELTEFPKVHVRVSLKAGTPKEFTRKTGALPEAFEIPFQAIRHLMKYKVSFHVAAMSGDPRIMSANERQQLISRLYKMNPQLLRGLEEETVDPYRTTLFRLKTAGVNLDWSKALRE